MQGCVSFAVGIRISTLLTFFLATSLTGIPARGQNTFAMHSHGSTGAASACNKGRWDGPIDLAPETMRGKLTHPVSTTSKEVQGYFDQGLVFLYGFDNESAMRSFHKAALLDPKLAMAHWGVALAAGGDLNIAIDDPCMARAIDEIAQAKKLGSASLPEQRYIKALSCRYGVLPSCDDAHPIADPEDLSLAYADQMRLLYQMDNGTDPDAAGLFAYALMDLHPWQWWRHDGTPTPEIVETVKVIQTGLPNFPNHIGLNHIYIHAMEGSYPEGRGSSKVGPVSPQERPGDHAAPGAHAGPHLPAAGPLGRCRRGEHRRGRGGRAVGEGVPSGSCERSL
jgi:hypothetical protein